MRRSSNETASAPPLLFQLMARRPFPFMVAVPLLLVILLATGLTRKSFFEGDISRLWIPSDASYAKDKEYVRQVHEQAKQPQPVNEGGGSGRRIQETASLSASADMGGMSAFLAMALSRHGDNLFTEENLETIRQRMELVESIQVSHNGNNYTWDDICAVNGLSNDSTYKFPCLRLSPMDLFEEAGWYFKEEHKITWYKEARQAIRPIVNRFGVMLDMCTTPSSTEGSCDHLVKLRSDPDYAIEHGYPPEHAHDKPSLIHDMFSLPGGDPCGACIDSNLPVRMNQLHSDHLIPSFTVLTQELRRLLFALEEQKGTEDWMLEEVRRLVKKTASIAIKTTLEDVEEFYSYYVIRHLYATWGAKDYQWTYREVNSPKYRNMFCNVEGITCPPDDVTLEESVEHLFRHVDSPFSSTSSAGVPLPFWGLSEDGSTGALFAGSMPVSGSGVNMSAPMDSMATYLDLANHGTREEWRPYFYKRNNAGYMDPLGEDYLWKSMVESNPLYAWFMAGETEMTAHCGNGDLPGTNVNDITINALTAGFLKSYTQRWCTKFNTPFEQDGNRSKQHFARMWFDMLVDSQYALDIVQGVSGPYNWTIGLGCGYNLGGSRFSYKGQTEEAILEGASTALYNVDEGLQIGELDRTIFIGDAYPPVGEYSEYNPLQHVGLLQNLYPAMIPEGIINRVKHKNRPDGPLEISIEDAAQVLSKFKESFQDMWSTGWDDDKTGGDVQFVGFFDDAGVPGTIGGFLKSTTLSSGLLMAVSFLVIGAFSVIFLVNCNPIESRAGIAIVGVLLVMLSFFAAVGFAILIGIKVNLTIAWTLPFIILGLGVDNMYILLLSLRQQLDYSEKSFFKGMQEVLAPISMTSIVNASIFVILNSNSMPAVHHTAQVGLFSTIFVYLSTIFCFPAYCFLDMRRQAAGRRDVLVWMECSEQAVKEYSDKSELGHWLDNIMFGRFYRPLMLGSRSVRRITHSLVCAVALALLGMGCLGTSKLEYGLGLEDVLPSSGQANVWATARTESLGSWIMGMSWGALDYGDSDVQMQMMKQFEDVVSSQYVTDMNTADLWIASFNVWTTRQCSTENCGRDQVYRDGSTCAGTWKRNKFGLRYPQAESTDKLESCAIPKPKSGVCLPTSHLHFSDLMDLTEIGVDPSENDTWCPVFERWSNDKMRFCLGRWGGGGGLLHQNGQVKVPIPLSTAPTITGFGMTSHEKTMEMLRQTRSACDDHPDLHCWMTGPPFDFWTQYEGIYMNLVQVGGACVAAGFAGSFLFLASRLFYERHHGPRKILFGSAIGALLIASTCSCSLIAVIGLSSFVGVRLTAFSIMSFALSTGFSVEYAVHIVSRWLCADNSKQQTSLDHVEYAMSCLVLPTGMSFVSSILGVACLAFSGFDFNFRFFFKPLIIAMFVTYFYGCYFLPVILIWLDFDATKLGPKYSLEDAVFLSPLSKLQSSEHSYEVYHTSVENLDMQELPTLEDKVIGDSFENKPTFEQEPILADEAVGISFEKQSKESSVEGNCNDSRFSPDPHIIGRHSSSDVMSGLSSLESLQAGATNSNDETVQIRNGPLEHGPTSSLDETVQVRNTERQMTSPSSLLGSLKKILSSTSSDDYEDCFDFVGSELKSPSGTDNGNAKRRSVSPETCNSTTSATGETESACTSQQEKQRDDQVADLSTHKQQLVIDPNDRAPQSNPTRLAQGVSTPRRPGHYHQQINEDDVPRRSSPVKFLQTIVSGMFMKGVAPETVPSPGRRSRTSYSLSPRKRNAPGAEAFDFVEPIPSSLSMNAMDAGGYDFSNVMDEAPKMPSEAEQERVTVDSQFSTRSRRPPLEEDTTTIVM